MKSRTTRRFWQLFAKLLEDAQERAPKAYGQFRTDPSHPGLNFKRVNDEEPIYSARVGTHYRALGLLKGDSITWLWIGSHDDYERVLKG